MTESAADRQTMKRHQVRKMSNLTNKMTTQMPTKGVFCLQHAPLTIAWQPFFSMHGLSLGWLVCLLHVYIGGVRRSQRRQQRLPRQLLLPLSQRWSASQLTQVWKACSWSPNGNVLFHVNLLKCSALPNHERLAWHTCDGILRFAMGEQEGDLCGAGMGEPPYCSAKPKLFREVDLLACMCCTCAVQGVRVVCISPRSSWPV